MTGSITPWKNSVVVTTSEQRWLALGGLIPSWVEMLKWPACPFLWCQLSHQCPVIFSLALFGLVLDTDLLQSLLQLFWFFWAIDRCTLPSPSCSHDIQFSSCCSLQSSHCLILVLEGGQQCWGGLLPGQREARDALQSIHCAEWSVLLLPLWVRCHLWGVKSGVASYKQY